MALKHVVFVFFFLLTGFLTACQNPDNNILETHTHPADHWRYCWPHIADPAQVDPQQLLRQRTSDCREQWQTLYPPLNPPGREQADGTLNHWVWLELTLPGLDKGDHLYMRGVDEEFMVYEDHELLYRFGAFKLNSHTYQGFPWHMIPLSPQLSHEKIYFLVHSEYRHIGIFGQPRLGSKAAHLYQMLYMDLDRVVVGGLLIFTGIMGFLLFLRQPILAYEWLCLFATTIGLYLIMRTEIKQLYFYAPVLTKWIEVLTLYTAVPAVTLFLNHIFVDEKTVWWRRLILVQVLVSAACLSLAAFQWISIQQTTSPFLFLTLLNMSMGLWIVVCNFRSYGRSGWLAMAGIASLCGFTAYDILASLKILPWVRPVTHWGVLAVLISLVLLVKQQVDQLYQEKRLAEESDRVKTSFLTNFSHEIRTPLNAIIGFSDLLKKENTQDKVKEYSAIISDSGKSLLSMINDILDLGKIEANRLELTPTTFQVRRLCEQMHQMFSLEASKRKLEWEVSIADNVPELLRLDGGKLRQVLTNLLGNAFKFTESGFIRLSFFYRPRGHNSVLEVTVSDSGIGMNSEQVEQVFEPFYQAEHHLHRRFAGTGLGLTITQRLIQLMGGDVKVKSVPGEGTTFSFFLPVTPVQIEKTQSEVLSQNDSAAEEWNVPVEVYVQLQKDLNQLMQQKSIQRIQAYADLLIQKGQDHKDMALARTGEKLVDAVSQFDIGKINDILGDIERLCAEKTGTS